MKFIQSYWTKPIRNDESKLNSNKIIYNLSSFLIKKHFPEIELHLVTDSLGLTTLNTSHYDSIRLDFDHPFFDSIDEMFWAVPKILSLLKYTTPYIHIDGDFFITDKDKVKEIFREDYDVIIQCKESGQIFKQYYQDQLKIFNHILKQKETDVNYAYNCGVLGFKNQKAADRFLTQFLFIFSLCLDNLKYFKNEPKLLQHAGLNSLIEQHLLAQTCFIYNYHVKEIVPQIDFQMGNWCAGIDPLNRFFHPIGSMKYSEKILDFIKDFLIKYESNEDGNIPNLSAIVRGTNYLVEDLEKNIYNEQLVIYKNFMVNHLNNWREDVRFPGEKS